jgi:hypothetical protein
MFKLISLEICYNKCLKFTKNDIKLIKGSFQFKQLSIKFAMLISLTLKVESILIFLCKTLNFHNYSSFLNHNLIFFNSDTEICNFFSLMQLKSSSF